MGREKRIAESRTKEILEKKTAPAAERSQVSNPSPAVAPVVPPAQAQKAHHALLNIILLFLVPAVLMVLVGKFVFKL